MSKSFTKLIDAALIPAAIMICGKVFGLWFANTIFGLDWNIANDPNDIFSIQVVYTSVNDQIIASSYSNLIMYMFVLIGFSFILTRALFFSKSNISPRTIARLATRNLLNLIGDSFEIYHRASVWLVVLWLALFALAINILMGKAYVWTGIVSFFCTIIATVLLLRDVSKEITIARKLSNDKKGDK